jgi:N4-gp56 family major capsid protein
MAIQSTSNLTNAVGERRFLKYVESAMFVRLYDQFAEDYKAVGTKQELENLRGMGSSYKFNFLSKMTPATSAISEVYDVVPQILRDATASITPTSRADGLEWTELLDIEAFTNYAEERMKVLGEGSMESIELLAIAAALQGGLVDRATARASLDAGTSGHRFNDAAILKAGAMVRALKCVPFMEMGTPQHLAVGHSDITYDLIQSGNLNTIMLYQDKALLTNRGLFNGEVGEIGGFRVLASPWGKVFGGAGADNGTNVDTTLSSAANALAKQIVVASATSITVGRTLTIGTEETGNTFRPTNEIVRVSDLYSSGTTVDVISSEGNNGLRYDHASGEAVRNADNVYPVAYGSPGSLVKVYAEEIGEFGKVVGPKPLGNAETFAGVFYKFYGGYGRIGENWIMRGEYSSSLQA